MDSHSAAAGTGAAADREGRLAAQTAGALLDAGFARHFVPRAWGGQAGTFSDAVAAVTAVAEACASAAWCAALWAWHARFAAILPDRAQQDLWADGPDVPIAAGLMPPAGTVDEVPGGFRVSGRWDCVSGIAHSTWVLLCGPGPGGPPLVLAVPRQQCEVEPTWRAAGLRATGSDTVVVTGVTVPAHRTVAAARLLAGSDAPGASRCHTVPAHLAGGLLLAAVGVGAGRAAVTDLLAAAGTPPPEVASALGRAGAELDAAALVLARAAGRADDDPVTEVAVARNRRDAAFAMDLAVTATQRLIRLGGRPARDTGSVVNRAWRDAHTAAAHGALRLETAAQVYVAATLGGVNVRGGRHDG